jgi:CDP-2,3-bis-(O-geranylgeranyl)-sn-glycerol synthase
LLGWLFGTIIYPIIYIFPAYAANGAPVIFGGGRPLDMGRKLRGKRIFGDHKTIKGTVSGAVCGVLAGAIEAPFFPYMLAIAVALTAGAIFGDLFGSFLKRRMNHNPGAQVPVLDQYGFFIFAMLAAFQLGHLPSVYGIIFIIILTGALHVLTNMGAHKLRLKDVPW